MIILPVVYHTLYIFKHSIHSDLTGGCVVHSYGRLILHEFPITDLQQISGPDRIGRINCTVSSGTARFVANGGPLEIEGVSQTRNGATTTLVVNPSNVDSFQNRDLYCTNITANLFYLSLSSASKPAYIFTCKILSVHNIHVLRQLAMYSSLLGGSPLLCIVEELCCTDQVEE